MINHVTLAGNLTREPEVKTLPSGSTVTNAGVAVTERRKGADGEYHDVPHFFDLTIFGRKGELLAEKAKTGDLVHVDGRLSFRSWEDQSGGKRSKVEVVVNDIQGAWMYNKSNGSAPAPAASAPAAPAAPADPAAADDDIPF